MRTPEENAPITDICSHTDLACSVIETVPGEWRLDFDLLDDSPTIVDVNAACDLITTESSENTQCTDTLEDLGTPGGTADLNFDAYGRVYFKDPLFAPPVTYDPFEVAGALDMSTSSVKSPSSNELVPNRNIEPDSLTIGILGAIVVIVSSVRALWAWEMRRLSLPENLQVADPPSPVPSTPTPGRIQNIITILNHSRVKANHLPDADPNIKPQIDSSSPYFTRAHKGVVNRQGKRKN